MSWKSIILVTFLFLGTLIPIGYKTLVLDLDIFPKLKKDIWQIEFSSKVKAGPEIQNIEFPVPEASSRVTIFETRFDGKTLSVTLSKTKDGTYAHLKGIANEDLSARYRVLLKSQTQSVSVPKKEFNRSYPEKVKEYLAIPNLSEALTELIENLEREILPITTNKVKIAKAIYYFVSEEIIQASSLGVENALLQTRGSSKDKAQLVTLLMRRQGIPARTIRGIKLIDRDDTRRRLTYWNEVFLGKEWIPLFNYRGKFGEIQAPYIPLFTSIEFEKNLDVLDDVLAIHAKRLLSDEFNAIQYKKELAKKNSKYLSFSPYLLPLSEQPELKMLLLFTVGCVVLSVCRNIIGVKTFGVFFPVLIALFFKATSISFGLSFFIFVVLLGYGERRILKEMYLLAVPRFSIILTLLVMTMLVYGVLNHKYSFSSHSPTILPIIITTMFIERFSITMEEEGWKSVLTSLLGSFSIAFLAYGLFSWKSLEIFIYTHPEILFTILAILVLIGKYTGYRISELLRFRELAKNREKYVS